MIATFPARNYDIERYPAVKNYLLSFAEPILREAGLDWVADNHLADYCHQKLAQTGKYIEIAGQRIRLGSGDEKARKKTSNKWFETQDSISYWDDFSKPKIAWGNLNLRASFSFVGDAFFLNAPCPMIVPGDTYLLKFINSDIVDYCIRNLGVTRNGGYFEYKPMFVSQALIPLAKSIPIDLYDRIIDEEDDNVINELVASAFKLSDEEYNFIKAKLHGL